MSNPCYYLYFMGDNMKIWSRKNRESIKRQSMPHPISFEYSHTQALKWIIQRDLLFERKKSKPLDLVALDISIVFFNLNPYMTIYLRKCSSSLNVILLIVCIICLQFKCHRTLEYIKETTVLEFWKCDINCVTLDMLLDFLNLVHRVQCSSFFEVSLSTVSITCSQRSPKILN